MRMAQGHFDMLIGWQQMRPNCHDFRHSPVFGQQHSARLGLKLKKGERS